jgi:hypothetical protein
MKLKYEAFIELNSHLADHFYENFSPLKWHNFNFLAVDGTTLKLPRIDAITIQRESKEHKQLLLQFF